MERGRREREKGRKEGEEKKVTNNHFYIHIIFVHMP